MMASQMKLHVCQWHTLHRALVCRLYQPGQQSNPQSVELTNQRCNHTQAPNGCLQQFANHTAKSNVQSRQYSQYVTNNTSRHRVPVSSLSFVAVPRRCLSTSRARGTATRTRINPAALKTSRYVITPEMASLMVDKIWNGESVVSERVQSLIVEANPGPGQITRELLNRGVKRVVVLEHKPYFMKDLKQLASQSNGRLVLFQGNYFNLAKRNKHHKLIVNMRDLYHGVEPRPWKTTDPKFAINVVGALPQYKEQGHAFYLASQVFHRVMAFRYGRVQHNLIMSEKLYRMMVQEPGDKLRYYSNISTMFQLCCDVKLLHLEPQESFVLNGSRAAKNPKNLCLVQLTPKLDFFDCGLAPDAMYLFIYFLRQMLVHRRTTLKEKIEVWAPGHSDIIFDFNFTKKTRTGDLSGSDYLRVFQAISKLDTFNEWMGGHEYGRLGVEEEQMDDQTVEQSALEEEEQDDKDVMGIV